jgi:hypothetical protein
VIAIDEFLQLDGPELLAESLTVSRDMLVSRVPAEPGCDIF